MKKRFTLMLLAALVAVASFAQPVKKQPVALKQLTEAQRTPNIKPFRPVAMSQVSVPMPKKAIKKAPKKAASLADFSWPMSKLAISYNYVFDDNDMLAIFDINYSVVETTINMVDETTLSFEGLYVEAEEPIFATVNPEDMTFEIAPNQTLFTSDFGTVILVNAYDSGEPLTGQIYEDGSIAINELWYAALGEDSDYAGFQWSDYIYDTQLIIEPNGVMSYTLERKKYTDPVYIYQDNFVTTVFNFGGDGIAIDINMKEDGVFEIQEQPAKYNYGYELYYTYATDGSYVWNPITGSGTNDVLTFTDGWTFFNDDMYWTKLHSATTIKLNVGAGVFEFPVIDDVAATPDQPYMVDITPYIAAKGYGSVIAHVPNTDEDGNLLKESKLFYMLYSDIDGEIAPITLLADLYGSLEEDIIEIPFTLNDNYDFDIYGGEKRVWLNFDYSGYDRIGVQSVYYGGDERNETQIEWMVVPKIIPGTPATPSVASVTLAGTNYPKINFDIPTVTTDGNEMFLDYVYYMFTVTRKDGTTFDYTCKAEDYYYLDEDMTWIPYNFQDNFDIYKGGNPLYVYDEDVTTWQTIKVRTLYELSEDEFYYSDYGVYDLSEYWATHFTGSEFDEAFWSTYYNSQSGYQADGNTTVYVARLSEDKTVLYLTEVTDKIINQGEAVILASSEANIALESTDEESSFDYTGNSLSGVDEQTAVPTDQGTICTLSIEDNSLAFRKYTGSELKAHKAYLALDAASGVKIRIEFGDATGINGISTAARQNSVYTLDGRQLNGIPTARGIYIVNGKKTVVK